jgi:hypothetical protein
MLRGDLHHLGCSPAVGKENVLFLGFIRQAGETETTI